MTDILMSADSLLALMGKLGASVLHLTVGMPPVFRIQGRITALAELARVVPETAGLAKRAGSLKPENLNLLANQLLTADRHRMSLTEKGFATLARSIPGVGRFRVHIYTQRGSLALVCHALFDEVPSLDDFFPGEALKTLLTLPAGLIMVAGPVNSGKTTMAAAVVHHINRALPRHILVIEDPIEYLHVHDKSLVNQRQVGEDVRTYAEALATAMDQDADIIVTGDLPDRESVLRALVIAEAGKLVLTALQAVDAREALARILDLAGQRSRLSAALAGLIELRSDHSFRIIDRPGAVKMLSQEVDPSDG